MACFFPNYLLAKGQIKPKAGLAQHRFSQETNERLCFICCEKQKSKQNKFFRSFFGRIYGAPISFRFYLTFMAFTGSLELFLTKTFFEHEFPKRSQSSPIVQPTLQAFMSCLILNCRTCRLKHASMKIHDALMIRRGIFL